MELGSYKVFALHGKSIRFLANPHFRQEQSTGCLKAEAMGVTGSPGRSSITDGKGEEGSGIMGGEVHPFYMNRKLRSIASDLPGCFHNTLGKEFTEFFPFTKLTNYFDDLVTITPGKFLAEGIEVSPSELSDRFEFGMTLHLEATQEYLETVDHHFGVFHVILMEREGLDEYLAGTGEGKAAYVFQMTVHGNRLTPDPRYQTLKLRAGWRAPADEESSESAGSL